MGGQLRTTAGEAEAAGGLNLGFGCGEACPRSHHPVQQIVFCGQPGGYLRLLQGTDMHAAGHRPDRHIL